MKSQGFPRQVRVRTQYEYQAVFKKPYRVSVDYLIALCHQNTHSLSRLGVSVPKRAVKQASDRNTVKRVIRESFRRRQAQFDSLDIVIVVKSPPSTVTKRELSECIERLWQKVQTQLVGR